MLTRENVVITIMLKVVLNVEYANKKIPRILPCLNKKEVSLALAVRISTRDGEVRLTLR